MFSLILFLKLNITSIIYSLFLFFYIELLLNPYRISRIWNLSIEAVVMISNILFIIELILIPLLVFFFVTRYLYKEKKIFWTIYLCVPYTLFWIWLFAITFPITYKGDIPPSITGLIILLVIILYPLYLLFFTIIFRK